MSKQPHTLTEIICKWFEKSFFEKGLYPSDPTDNVLGRKIERNVRKFLVDYQEKTGMGTEKVAGLQNFCAL